MNQTLRIIIGIFIILHGLVHPIMALVPQPIEDLKNEAPIIGGFWTESWLLGKGPAVKTTIYVMAALAALVLLVAGIGLIGSHPWAKPVLIAGAGLSLLLLLLFWNLYLVVGVLIDLIILGLTFWTSLLPT
ncbi:MAG: hypothetical protein JXJ17_14635 [Anaerolineae bacterium]|nr:hypothetical protein [Anaerolineae bacterium]